MPRIGLVLSGGLGKGAYQIGALSALSEYFTPGEFAAVSAASIGSLNAYAYMSGILDYAREVWESVDFRGSMRSVITLMRSSFLRNVISTALKHEEMHTPFYVPLLDADKKVLEYLDFSKISTDIRERYFLAAISLPIVNQSVDIEGRSFFDGGIVDNIPVTPLLDYELDYIICIYFDELYIFENEELDRKIIKITFPDDTIISSSVDIRHESIMYMIDAGYRKTREVLEQIFSEGTYDVKRICEQIAQHNSAPGKHRLRLTMDVAISNLNRVMAKLQRSQNRRAGKRGTPEQAERIDFAQPAETVKGGREVRNNPET